VTLLREDILPDWRRAELAGQFIAADRSAVSRETLRKIAPIKAKLGMADPHSVGDAGGAGPSNSEKSK
jgi:hypothetical protein